MADSSHYSMITIASFACEVNIPYGWSDHLSLSQQEEAGCFEQKFGLQWHELLAQNQYFGVLIASAGGMQQG